MSVRLGTAGKGRFWDLASDPEGYEAALPIGSMLSAVGAGSPLRGEPAVGFETVEGGEEEALVGFGCA
jgi:hypothetical protein